MELVITVSLQIFTGIAMVLDCLAMLPFYMDGGIVAGRLFIVLARPWLLGTRPSRRTLFDLFPASRRWHTIIQQSYRPLPSMPSSMAPFLLLPLGKLSWDCL
ncbi:MAG: hypothetical protein M0003_14580 [Acidithiobacillus sp.]|nr:hypothetical protein [Acidithiobacillus sp.]